MRDLFKELGVYEVGGAIDPNVEVQRGCPPFLDWRFVRALCGLPGATELVLEIEASRRKTAAEMAEAYWLCFCGNENERRNGASDRYPTGAGEQRNKVKLVAVRPATGGTLHDYDSIQDWAGPVAVLYGLVRGGMVQVAPLMDGKEVDRLWNMGIEHLYLTSREALFREDKAGVARLKVLSLETLPGGTNLAAHSLKGRLPDNAWYLFYHRA